MPLRTLDELLALRALWHNQQQSLVLTNGVFDLLHAGHVQYLRQARTLGDRLVVALNSDQSTRAIKGPLRPLTPQAQRAAVLDALACVDEVVVFEEPTAEAIVAALRPEVYVKGGDYASSADQTPFARLPEAQIVLAYGGRVELLPYAKGLSTSALIQRIVDRFGGASG